MALETASYVSQLNASNPVHTDGLNAADAHLRLLKAALLATFPNFTAAALNSTQAAIDAAVASVSTNGVAILAAAGAFFKTNTTDGFTNPAAGTLALKCAGVVAATFTATSVALPGTLSTAGLHTATGGLSVPTTAGIAGPGAVPVGGTIVWWTDTLPSGGNWAWANGQAISRTTNATLFGLLGTAYGPGDGSTTFNLPDLRDNVPVGKGTMGGTGAVGRITNFVSTTLGNLFGECLHLLTKAEIPTGLFTFNDAAHTHNRDVSSTGGSTDPTVVQYATRAGTVVGEPSTPAATGCTITDHAGNQPHDNVQPSIVCNWIMRVA